MSQDELTEEKPVEGAESAADNPDDFYDSPPPEPKEADKKADAGDQDESDEDGQVVEKEEKSADADGADKAAKKADSDKDETVPLKRLSKEVAKRRQAERDLAAIRAEIEALKAAKPAEKEGLTGGGKAVNEGDGPKEPDPTDTEKYPLGEYDPKFFKDFAAYVSEVSTAKSLAEARRLIEAERKSESEAVEAKTHAQKVETFFTLGSSKHDDFEEWMQAGGALGDRLSPAIGEAFLEDPDLGVEAAQYLATNEKALEEVSALSPVKQVAWFGRFAEKQEAKKRATGIKSGVQAAKHPKGTAGRQNKASDDPYDGLYDHE